MKNFKALFAVCALALCGGMFSCQKETDGPRLSVTPADNDVDITKPIGFSSDDKTVLTFNVSQNSGSYSADAEEGKDWVVITKLDTRDAFTLAVKKYTQAEAIEANFAEREAVITVTAGDATPFQINITQSAPAKISLTAESTELVFAPNVTSMTTTISFENVLSRYVMAGNIDTEKYPWIKSSTLDEDRTTGITTLTVMVDVLAFLEGTANEEDRIGEVTVKCTELPEPLRIRIVQKPLVMMNLSGQWKVTAGEVIKGNGRVDEEMSILGKTLTATYSAERGSFTFSGITYMKELAYGHTKDELDRWTGGIKENVEMNAGISLRGTTDGKVTFTTMDETGLIGVDHIPYGLPAIELENPGNTFLDYRNMRGHGVSGDVTVYDIPFDKTANVISFPTDALYGFGSLRYEYKEGEQVYVDKQLGYSTAYFLFHGLVLTKIED
jgi:hypothetical protein